MNLHSNIVLSAMVIDDELIPAQRQKDFDSACNLDVLLSWQVEADCRMDSHINWGVDRGCERIVVLSNDTYTIVIILRYLSSFINRGLKELWVEFGTGKRRRKISLHLLHLNLGEDLCSVLIKAHVLCGQDNVSKVGTKHTAMSCQPLSMMYFVETDTFCNADVMAAEKFLVKVWACSWSKSRSESFYDYRYECYFNGKAIGKLPPTSAAIIGHTRRSFYDIWNIVTLLDAQYKG